MRCTWIGLAQASCRYLVDQSFFLCNYALFVQISHPRTSKFSHVQLLYGCTLGLRSGMLYAVVKTAGMGALTFIVRSCPCALAIYFNYCVWERKRTKSFGPLGLWPSPRGDPWALGVGHQGLQFCGSQYLTFGPQNPRSTRRNEALSAPPGFLSFLPPATSAGPFATSFGTALQRRRPPAGAHTHMT